MVSNGMEQSLSKAMEGYLSRRGGTVVERLVGQMKKVYREDAPELQSNEALKAFVAKNPETFKVITSCNSVERVKLVHPPKRERRRHNPLLMDVAIELLEDMGCTEEGKATSLTELYTKASAEYSKRLAAKQAEGGEEKSDSEASPPELASEDDFARALGPRRRVVLRTGRVWLQARSAREGGRSPRGVRGRRGPRDGAEGEESNGYRPRGERRGREPRTPRPVGVPQDISLPSDANDSTLIAKIIYDKLKTRSAEAVETGLPIKVVLRIVSLAFKEARPDVDASAMNSLRVFKHFLSELPGVSRERPPRRRQNDNRSQSRRPPPPLETVVWITNEEALVSAIKSGLPEELAHADITPEVMENNDNAQQGVPATHKVLNQETWVTTVIGPTSSEEVLKKFLADNADQQIWGFETEHRVGLARRPAGNIAIIAISSLSSTFLWDSHSGGIPDCLHSWLADDRFFKGGVKVGPKAQKLRVQFAAAPKQFIELTTIAQSLGYIEEASKAGMRVISKNILNLPVNRPPGIRDSNWELRPLTKGQYHYAIEDAYVSALLFVHMSAELHKQDRGEMLMKAAINLE